MSAHHQITLPLLSSLASWTAPGRFVLSRNAPWAFDDDAFKIDLFIFVDSDLYDPWIQDSESDVRHISS